MAADDLELVPSIRSKPIEVKAIVDQPFTIKHELNRVPAGWFVVDTTGPVNLWRSGEMNTQTLTLTADQTVKLTLLLL